MADIETTECAYKSPLRKLVAFFQRSRDGWKAKHQAVKAELKREQNQRRAVEKSRQAWRAQAEDAKRRIRELEQELAAAKKQPAGTARAAM
jgi:chromosome segregation ATPase